MACKATIMGYEVSILADGYEKGWSFGNGPWRKVTYVVPWEDSDGFIDAITGANVIPVILPGAPWIPPILHSYPGNANLVVTDVRCLPLGASQPDDVKLFASDNAIIEATYTTPPFNMGGETFQPEMAFGSQPEPWSRDTIRSFVESVPVPAGALQRNGGSGGPSGGTPPSGDEFEGRFEIQVPHLELRRTMFHVPYLMIPELVDLVGKLNDDWFWGFAPGTLRFEPFDTDIEKDSAGNSRATLTKVLTWREHDWNKRPKADGPGWEYIGYPGTSEAPYKYADFRPAFGL